MTDTRDDKPGPDARAQRLREALRANLARRKDQARARAAADTPNNQTDPDAGGKTGKDS